MIVVCVVTEHSERKGKKNDKLEGNRCKTTWPPGVWYDEEAKNTKNCESVYFTHMGTLGRRSFDCPAVRT